MGSTMIGSGGSGKVYKIGVDREDQYVAVSIKPYQVAVSIKPSTGSNWSNHIGEEANLDAFSLLYTVVHGRACPLTRNLRRRGASVEALATSSLFPLLSDLVRSGSIVAGSVIKLVEFVFNIVQNHPIIIIANLEVVHAKCEITGSPINLTSNGIASIVDGCLHSDIQPAVQVVTVRAIGSANQGSGSERYRVSISDGCFTLQSMVSTQLNELVRSGSIVTGSVIKLVEFIFNVFQNRPILIIADLHVIHKRVDLIGQPEPYVWNDRNAPPIVRTSTPISPMNPPATNTISLTDGAIQMILDGRLCVESEILPLLQVLSIGNHPAANPKIGERYILCLSDGSFTQQGMLAMHHNELVRSGRIQEGSIVRLEEFFFGVVQNQPTIIIVNLQVIHPKSDPIGVPRPFPWKADGTSTLIGRAYTPSQYSQ